MMAMIRNAMQSAWDRIWYWFALAYVLAFGIRPKPDPEDEWEEPEQ